MHAFLVTGGTKEGRLRRIATEIQNRHVALFDRHRLIRNPESSSLGIADVKEWQKTLLLVPVSSPATAGIIEEAELLTSEAQQALLKTLEEPPPHTIIYVEAPSTAPLLPTILSRCHLLTIPTTRKENGDIQTRYVKTFQLLFDPSVSAGEKIALMEKEVADKETAKQWVATALEVLHANRMHFPKHVYRRFSKSLLRAHQELSANVSYKPVLDRIFLA